jgi:hypothetical protein
MYSAQGSYLNERIEVFYLEAALSRDAVVQTVFLFQRRL